MKVTSKLKCFKQLYVTTKVMPKASTTSRNNVTEPNTSRSGDGEVRGSGQRNMAVGLTEQREVSCRSNRRGAPRETEREATAEDPEP